MSASIADDLIRSYFDRWLRLEEEKRTISDDLKELFAEARGNGLDTKALRAVFREQVGDKTARDEFDAICDLYRASLERPRARPAHSAREIIEEFDAKTGEITEHEQPETGAAFNNGEDHDADSGQHVGRENREQQHAAPVQSADGRGEGADDGDQGQGAGASGPDRRVGAVERELDCQNEDGRSRDVGGEAHHAITPSDGGAIVAVKAQSRLANADSVEPSPSDTNPQPSPLSGADKPEAVSPPAVSGALSDDDVPAFLKKDQPPKTAKDYRPHCQRPEACGSSGLHHCYTCQKAIDAAAESEAA